MTTNSTDGGPPPMDQPAPGRRSGWTGGRVVSVVAGSLLGLIVLGLVAAGVAGLVWNGTQRDDGYLTSSTVAFHSSGYAVSGDRVRVGGGDVDWGWQDNLLGKVRVRVTPADPARPIFVGIAATGDVFQYLSGVAWSRVQRIGDTHVDYTDISGGAPAGPPAATQIWQAQAQGTGTQAVTWRVHGGDWSVVVMNADASQGIAFRADAGATVPWLLWVGIGTLVLAVLLAAASVALIMVPVKRVGRELRERGPLDAPS